MMGIPSSYRVHIWYGKTRLTELQSGAGRMIIDSVVSAQYINVSDRQTDSPVAIAVAALTQYASGGKNLQTF